MEEGAFKAKNKFVRFCEETCMRLTCKWSLVLQVKPNSCVKKWQTLYKTTRVFESLIPSAYRLFAQVAIYEAISLFLSRRHRCTLCAGIVTEFKWQKVPSQITSSANHVFGLQCFSVWWQKVCREYFASDARHGDLAQISLACAVSRLCRMW